MQDDGSAISLEDIVTAVRTISGEDPEVRVIKILVSNLDKLDDAIRARIIRYLTDRFGA